MVRINTAMTIQEQIEEVIKGLHPSLQLRELEKLGMKLRKQNSLRINKEVDAVRKKHPRIKM